MRALPASMFAAVVLLAGCATSRETVVLLPKADGSTGAIAASNAGSEVLLDSPFASARPGAGGRLKRGVEDPAALDKRFGPARAAMPPAPQSFTLYFLSGSDDFSAESNAAIARLLEVMRQRPSPEVSVVGHTDRVGSDADNDALSLQRAERVKEMLVVLGVPAERISASGRGWREPLVQTGRGVDEPRNRRVEVGVR